MKRVDSNVLRAFLLPLIITFVITDFLFLMQFLWKYIDELVGKGLDFSLIMRLAGLFSLTIVPLALPLAILLSSTMVMGNLGEDNELVAYKASGVSVLRVMASLIIFCGFLSVGAFYFSNYVLPNTHLKFYSLLWDIRKQKPALDIREGVFYKGLEGFTLRVQKKDPDNKTLYGIMVYDHTSGRGNDNMLMAEKGEIALSQDGQFLILTLFEGRQYQEMRRTGPSREQDREHERTEMTFKAYKKVFDLSQFKMTRTDQELFKDHYHMLNAKQLMSQADTIKMEIESRKQSAGEMNANYLGSKRLGMLSDGRGEGIDVNAYLQSFDPEHVFAERVSKNYTESALSSARAMESFADVTLQEIRTKEQLLARHYLEWNKKFSLSAACIFFLFIGGPLCAIIRKGGFGMPILISVVFFLVFHVLNIIGEKMTKEMVLPAYIGVWLPSLVLGPIGAFVTWKAVNDSRIFKSEWYWITLEKITNKLFPKR
jgi:lipopolysaccharide export system permease protein